MEQFSGAIRVDPNYAVGHRNLGLALLKGGQTSEALQQFHMTLDLAVQQEDRALADSVRAMIESLERHRSSQWTGLPFGYWVLIPARRPLRASESVNENGFIASLWKPLPCGDGREAATVLAIKW